MSFFCSPFRVDTANLDYINKLKKVIPSLIDYSKSIQDKKLFMDNFHLNKNGATKFSEIFAKQLINSNE